MTETQTTEATNGETNLTVLKDIIRDTVTEIADLKQKRSAITADINAKRKTLESKGINLAAVDMAVKILAKDEDSEKKEILADFGIVCEALGIPFQADLFEKTVH